MTAAECDDELYAVAVRDCDAVALPHDLNNVKSRYLGKNGALQKRLRAIGDLPKEERAAAGVKNNALRAALEQLFEQKKTDITRTQAMARANEERLDVTLPGCVFEQEGAVHPLQQTIERASAILSTIGFEAAEGPEIEDDRHNFELLNFPSDHPARDMHDTLYVKNAAFSENLLLRTHTSSVQIRHMLREKEQREEKEGKGGVAFKPIRVISAGRVYRRDNDATHSPMFHQIEGLWVDEEVRFTDLKGVLGAFFRAFFEDDDISVRFRPSYFPFTEPSAECDISRVSKKMRYFENWLEVAGCGMVHPQVLENVGIDSKKYRGFAFGMGVERLAMLYYGIKDIRLFFENDMRFLAQFKR